MRLIQCRRSGVSGSWLIIALFSMSGYSYSADEQQFGRLFTTREERRQLQELREEDMRATGGRDAVGTATPGMVERYGAGQTQAGMYRGAEQSEGDLPVITLKGLIYKKDWAGMAWVNAKEGTAALDYRELESGQVLDNRVTIELPMTGKSVTLKPGQSYHLRSGAVTGLKNDAP